MNSTTKQFLSQIEIFGRGKAIFNHFLGELNDLKNVISIGNYQIKQGDYISHISTYKKYDQGKEIFLGVLNLEDRECLLFLPEDRFEERNRFYCLFYDSQKMRFYSIKNLKNLSLEYYDIYPICINGNYYDTQIILEDKKESKNVVLNESKTSSQTVLC